MANLKLEEELLVGCLEDSKAMGWSSAIQRSLLAQFVEYVFLAASINMDDIGFHILEHDLVV